MGLFLIFFPFLLSTFVVIYSIISSIPLPGIIGYSIYLISTIFSLIILRQKNTKIWIIIYAILVTSILINYNNLFNYYYSTIEKNETVGKTFPIIKLTDKFGKEFDLKNYKNKIIIIDLWANFCGNCIKAFPNFEKLKKDFEKDSEVKLLSINIYNNNLDIKNSEKYLKGYSFDNYFSDKTIYKKLDFSSVPSYLIIGKDGKIKYFGNLNIETYETYNNIYKLIENEK